MTLMLSDYISTYFYVMLVSHFEHNMNMMNFHLLSRWFLKKATGE